MSSAHLNDFLCSPDCICSESDAIIDTKECAWNSQAAWYFARSVGLGKGTRERGEKTDVSLLLHFIQIDQE